MHGYASSYALIEAIRSAAAKPGGATRESVREELRSLDTMTPMGRVKFDGNGDPLFYRHVIVQVQGGKFVVVYPKDRATGRYVYPARVGGAAR
jgi:branched-chain amino acid transport system substrate-binding protein